MHWGASWRGRACTYTYVWKMLGRAGSSILGRKLYCIITTSCSAFAKAYPYEAGVWCVVYICLDHFQLFEASSFRALRDVSSSVPIRYLPQPRDFMFSLLLRGNETIYRTIGATRISGCLGGRQLRSDAPSSPEVKSRAVAASAPLVPSPVAPQRYLGTTNFQAFHTATPSNPQTAPPRLWKAAASRITRLARLSVPVSAPNLKMHRTNFEDKSELLIPAGLSSAAADYKV